MVPRGDYNQAHPDRAHLLVEVADSSLRKDRLIKGPLYAASGFEEYWLVNVATKVVEVHRHPSADGPRIRPIRSAPEGLEHLQQRRMLGQGAERFAQHSLRAGAIAQAVG